MSSDNDLLSLDSLGVALELFNRGDGSGGPLAGSSSDSDFSWLVKLTIDNFWLSDNLDGGLFNTLLSDLFDEFDSSLLSDDLNSLGNLLLDLGEGFDGCDGSGHGSSV